MNVGPAPETLLYALAVSRQGQTGVVAGRPTWPWWLATVAVLAWGVYEAAGVVDFLNHNERLPRWDMATNGWQAQQLALDLEAGRTLRFLLHINDHDTFPPGYSLLLLPAILVAGPDFIAATLPHAILFALTPVLLLALGWRIQPGPIGLWGALFASALFLSSPLPRVFSILLMREVPGAFFTLLALVLYLRAVKRATSRDWRIAAGAGVFLFFVKYNYGLSFLLVAGLHQVLIGRPERGWRLAHMLRQWLWPWRGDSGWRKLGAGMLYALLVLALLGQTISSWIYYFVILATLILALRWHMDGRRLLGWIRGLAMPARAGVELVLLPVWIWFLSPSPVHVRAFLGFLQNRSTEASWKDALAFYPMAFVGDYVEDARVGVLVLMAAVVGGVWVSRGSVGWKMLSLTTAVMVLLAVVHPYKLPRFLFTAVPLLFLLAGLGMARLLHDPWPVGWRRSWIGGVLAAAALSALVSLSVFRSPERLRADYERYSGDPRLGSVLDHLRDRVSLDVPVGVVGTFDEISPSLVAWALHQRTVGRDFEVVPTPPRVSELSSADTLRRHTAEWIAHRGPQEIIALRFFEDTVWSSRTDFQRYNAWQNRIVEALDSDAGWLAAESHRHEDLGLVVTIYRPVLGPIEAPTQQSDS